MFQNRLSRVVPLPVITWKTPDGIMPLDISAKARTESDVMLEGLKTVVSPAASFHAAIVKGKFQEAI